MKIYTKSGDKGSTSLYDQKRVPKNSLRVESYGTIDELNASIGFARQFIKDEKVVDILIKIQRDLFNVGGELATSDYRLFKSRVTEDDVDYLEKSIDHYISLTPNEEFKFTLPGSTKSDSALHLSRTICRRAERRILDLADQEEVSETVLKYINRLSDLLYSLTLYFEDKPVYIYFDWETYTLS